MSRETLWVGAHKDSGSLWVFDPEMAHADDSMVFAFWVTPGRMGEYSKAGLRLSLATYRGARRQQAIDLYLNWKAKSGATFLEEERIRLPQRLKEAARRREDAARQLEQDREEAKAKHRAYLDEHGKPYSGVSEGVSRPLRSTHCYSCKSPLDSTLHIECNTCRWMICYCGACGCGYSN